MKEIEYILVSNTKIYTISFMIWILCNVSMEHFFILQRLKNTESDRLAVQVHAYLDNMIDVAQLLEDSETKSEALEKVSELEDELSHVRILLKYLIYAVL